MQGQSYNISFNRKHIFLKKCKEGWFFVWKAIKKHWLRFIYKRKWLMSTKTLFINTVIFNRAGLTVWHRFLCVCMLVALQSVFVPDVSMAQKRKVQYRPYIDQRRLHYGFLAGVHLQDLEFQNNGLRDEEGNEWYAETPNYEPGFSVGVLGELRLTNNLALRAVPTMHFGTKNVTFRNNLNNERVYQTIKSTYISVPIDLKFSAERFNNYRPYMVAGVNPMYDLTVKKGKNLLLKNFDCYLEVGFGCDFYLPFFKFIPEIKFAYGLSNVIDKTRHDLTNPQQLIYTNSVDKGNSKMIILSLYFE